MKIMFKSDKAIVTEYNSFQKQNSVLGCQCTKNCNCSEKEDTYSREHYFYVKSLDGKKGFKTYDKNEAIARYNFLNKNIK